MTTWGTDGNLSVGVDLTTSDGTPSYGESITLTCKWYVKSPNRYNDNQTLNWIFAGSSGSVSFNNTVDGSSQLILTKTYTLHADQNTHTVQGHGTITGAYNGNSPTASDSITVPAAPGVPNAPVQNTITGINSAGAQINWSGAGTNGTAVTQYQVEWSTVSSFASYAATGALSSAARSYVINTLQPNTTYYARVRAGSSAGWGPWSSARSFTTAIAAPGAPSSIRLTDTSGLAAYAITMSFTTGATNGATGVTYDTCVSLYSNAGSPYSTTSSTTLSTGAPTTTIPINSFTALTPVAGDIVTILDPTRTHYQEFELDAGSTSTALAVISQTPTYAFPSGSVVLFGAAHVGRPPGSQQFSGAGEGIIPGATYYGFVRVASTSPSSVGSWHAAGATVTTGADGGIGDLVDRVNALASQLGADMAYVHSHFPSFSTAGRPSASASGVGAVYYDTTLHKPGWSDGTNWRDAAGSTI